MRSVCSIEKPAWTSRRRVCSSSNRKSLGCLIARPRCRLRSIGSVVWENARRGTVSDRGIFQFWHRGTLPTTSAWAVAGGSNRWQVQRQPLRATRQVDGQRWDRGMRDPVPSEALNAALASRRSSRFLSDDFPSTHHHSPGTLGLQLQQPLCNGLPHAFRCAIQEQKVLLLGRGGRQPQSAQPASTAPVRAVLDATVRTRSRSENRTVQAAYPPR